MEQRIKQSGLLQSQKDGIGAVQSSKSPLAQFYVRPAGPLIQLGNSEFGFLFSSPLKNPQHIARLRDLPALNRFQKWQDPLEPGFLGGGRRKRDQALRQTVFRVAFPEMRVLHGKRAIVV